MKERFSNILAWCGFSYPLLVILPALFGYKDFSRLLMPQMDYNSDMIVFTFLLVVYSGCGLINYLFIGRFRLLPWK